MFEILFALLPMVILVISMGICKWPGDKSSLLTLVITVMLAIFAFGIPAQEIGFTLINSPHVLVSLFFPLSGWLYLAIIFCWIPARLKC